VQWNKEGPIECVCQGDVMTKSEVFNIWVTTREKGHSDILKKTLTQLFFSVIIPASSRDINHLYSLKG